MDTCAQSRETAATHSNFQHSTAGLARASAVRVPSALWMNILRVLGLVLLALALVSVARAGSINLTLDPNYPSDYHFYTYTVGGQNYTLPTGPYPAILSGGKYGTGTLAYLICFDINVDTYVGQTYAGSLVTPTDTTQLEVSYLMAQLSHLGGYYAPVNTVSGPISLAIWQLENPSSVNSTPFVLDPTAQVWVDAAVNAVQSDQWTVEMAAQYPFWSPDNLSASQRFGIVDTVPEPTTCALVGASLISLGLFFRKRLNRH